MNVIKRLTRAGNTVIYYATEEYQELIEATGAEFQRYPSKKWDVIYGGGTGNDYSFVRFLHMQAENVLLTHEEIYPAILEEAKKLKAQAVFHDSYAYWGKRLAQELKLPAISFVPNYLIPRAAFLGNQTELVQGLFDAKDEPVGDIIRKINFIEKYLKKKHKLENVDIFDFMLNQEKLNIVFSVKETQMFHSILDDSFYYVGASVNLDSNKTHPVFDFVKANRKIIYISLGTVVNSNYNFFSTCIEVAKQMKEYDFIISVGKQMVFADKPKNVYLGNYLPQCAILSRASLFITHAGHNSVNEALYYGVPMIFCPLGNEQFVISNMLECLGVGKLYHAHKINEKTLKQVIYSVLYDELYKQKSDQYKRIFRTKSKKDSIVKLIIDYIKMENVK